jgi:GT2 family glycosyltransferase
LLEVAHTAAGDVGAVAALMVFSEMPDVVNSAGIEVDRLGVATDRLLGQPTASSEADPVEVFGVSAGAALYRRAMLDEVPFDPSFFAYLEDVDVAWRARMRGWRSLYAPSAVVRHRFSATARHGSATKYYWSGRNRVRLLARNATTAQLVRHFPVLLAFDLGYIAWALVMDRSLAPIRGRLDGLRSWRSDRRSCASRRAVELPPFIGFRAAFRKYSAANRAIGDAHRNVLSRAGG